MKKNFDNNIYFKKQKEALLENLQTNCDRVYVEVGGKLIEDFHSSRVLSNYDPDIKYKIVKDVVSSFEFIVCINSISIIKKKKRRDTKKTYTDEILKLIDLFKKDNIKFNVVITRYRKNKFVDDFIKKLNDLNYNVYKHYENKNYPLNVDKLLEEDGLLANDYVPCKEKTIYVVAPGTNSGKLSVCISQIFHEKQNKIKSTYRKFETFLIPTLSINHPINLACSMAMCDVRGDDCIDIDYLNKHGEMRCIDERDKMSFEILKHILPNMELKKRSSISDYFVNYTIDGIKDIKLAESHAKKEIVRRYKENVKKFKTKKISQKEFDEASRIYCLIQRDTNELSKKETEALLKQFIDFWGYECQSNVCIEELSELIKSICKYKREDYDEKYKYNILEELADVHNMVLQLELYFGVDEINKIRSEKILRTVELLKQERIEKDEK